MTLLSMYKRDEVRRALVPGTLLKPSTCFQPKPADSWVARGETDRRSS